MLDILRFSLSLAAGVLLAASPAAAQVRITEIMQSNVTAYFDQSSGDYPDSWVELYNAGTTQVDLSAYSIGIKKSADKAYALPRNTILRAGEYLLVLCDKEATGLHTSFRLESDEPGRVILFRDGIGCDTVAHPAQPAPDIAYGQDPATGQWGYELKATPGKANFGGVCDATHLLGEPVFSHAGCVSPGFQSVSIALPAGAPEGAAIRYTLDGSLPTEASQVLVEGERIDVSRGTTTIRARVFAEGWLSPWATSHSYIHHHDVMTMPIVSLTTDKKHLDDRRTGILSGWNYENDWRRPVNIEYFEAEGDGAILNQPGETRVGGGWSRSLPLKSLILYAHKRFGAPRLAHEFFPTQKPGMTDFKSIMLRNAGNDFYETYMRDAVVQRVFGGYAGLDWQAHRPAAVYINGEYKGILNLRERSNDNNIYTNYAGLEDIDMVENWEELKAGTMDAFEAMMDFVEQPGHSAEEIDSVFDSREYLDVHLMNLFFNNTDFPGNNIVHWRPSAGGRWRIVVKDTDYAMGIGNASSDSKAEPTFNTLEWLYTPNYPNANNWGNRAEHTLPYRRMVECAEIAEAFFDRAFVYFGDVLNARRVVEEIDCIREEMETEWMYHYDLYGYYSPYGTWNSCIGEMRDWVKRRSEVFPQMFAEYYSLGDLGTLAVDCESGCIPFSINGVTPSSLPFEGAYPLGRTVRFEALDGVDREIEWEITAGGSTTVEHGPQLEVAMSDGLSVKARLIDVPTGIAAPTRPAGGAARTYDLQGRPADPSARPGIYVTRRGNVSEKRATVR